MKKTHLNKGIITLAIIAATSGVMSIVFSSNANTNSLAILSAVSSAASTVISVHNANTNN